MVYAHGISIEELSGGEYGVTIDQLDEHLIIVRSEKEAKKIANALVRLVNDAIDVADDDDEEVRKSYSHKPSLV
tara:strand:- start:8379 stop:8600 length:222 start_codon:yes stop_codon:yes gene_type:complete